MIQKATLKSAEDFERQKNQIITDHNYCAINVDERPRSYPCLMVWYVEDHQDHSSFKYDYVYVTEFAGLPVKYEVDESLVAAFDAASPIVPFNLKSMGPSPDGKSFDVVIEPDAEKGRTLCKIFAMHLLAQLDEAKAKNYLEIQVRDDKGNGVVVTVRHQHGETPCQQLKESKEWLGKLARHIYNYDCAEGRAVIEEFRESHPKWYADLIANFGQYEVH